MFENLKVGDRVTRFLGGVIPIPMVVTKVGGGRIHAVPVDFPNMPEDHYQFCIVTGAEIDDDLGWGRLQTGSFIVRTLEDQ